MIGESACIGINEGLMSKISRMEMRRNNTWRECYSLTQTNVYQSTMSKQHKDWPSPGAKLLLVMDGKYAIQSPPLVSMQQDGVMAYDENQMKGSPSPSSCP
ncbi:hypothetical protein Tco_0017801 [Tanacetum coccineum]